MYLQLFCVYAFNNGGNTRAEQGSKDLIDIDLHLHILNCNKNWVSKLLLENEGEKLEAHSIDYW